jgi:hypothetical protein
VLEHLDDPGLLLRHAAAYMAPGCKLVVTVPGGWYSAFYSHIGHRRHYTPAQLSGLLESAGFAVERAYAAGFPFFNLYRMLVTLRGGGDLIAEAARAPSLLMRTFRRDLRCAVPPEPDAPVGLADRGRRPLSPAARSRPTSAATSCSRTAHAQGPLFACMNLVHGWRASACASAFACGAINSRYDPSGKLTRAISVAPLLCGPP